MLLMMLARGVSIIKIIGGSFLQSEAFPAPPSNRLVVKNVRAHDGFVGGPEGPKHPSKIHPSRGGLLPERM